MSVYRIHAARVQYVIEKRYASASLAIDEVARLIGISTQHVCRVLKRERGLTFADLLRDVRLREARRLLRESSCSMKEIAFRVGFRHPSQFTRVFSSECGMSPTEYRSREAFGDVHHKQAM
jgi:two-component system response regulator YesN